MPKKRVLKRLPRPERARILKEAERKGLTAEQVEKRYGVSKWTYYGWRKRVAKPKVARGAVPLRASTPSTDVFRKEIHAVLPGILREEIASALASLFGRKTW